MTPGDPTRVAETQWSQFRRCCADIAGEPLTGPDELHRFSVDRPEDFWRVLWDWCALVHDGPSEAVLTDGDVESARFFPDVRLNYAENLLRPLAADVERAPALILAGRPSETLSRTELRTATQRTATALSGLGVGPSSRVVVVAPNRPSTVIAVLAVTALGATVSTATADVRAPALLGRLSQVEPSVLMIDRAAGWDADDAYVRDLLAGLPTVEHVIVLDDAALPDNPVRTIRLADLIDRSTAQPYTPWPRLPFDHPLFIMFSSGTTGAPKAMVHGIGGTLLEHVKEHRLHGDLQPRDVLFFQTTTAWMMWNWQLSALAVGATIVLNDAPVTGPEDLWSIVADEAVTVFGTSPAYLQLCEDAGFQPASAGSLQSLRAVLTTGAVLHAWQFGWMRSVLGSLPVQSISGGTDIIGCFVLGHPEEAVVPGWSQTRSLGLDVAAVDEHGAELVEQVGELVCRSPFPSRPVALLRDPDGHRLHEAYYAQHPGMWTHGDLVEFSPSGRARLHGRSDGVLNIDGVRVGPAEIYAAVRGLRHLHDVMAVEQRDPGAPGQTRMVLLVVLRHDAVLDWRLEREIRTTLRRNASPAHVPALILSVPDLPVTHNGKPSERAARDAVNGDEIVNLASLRNPDCLQAIRAAVVSVEADRTTTEEAPGRAGATVSDLWAEVLGRRPRAATEHFFDGGGTSRQAISLLRRIRDEFGREVSWEDFTRDPSPSGLTASVARGARLGARPDVVVLAPGDPTTPPLVLFHDAWGDVFGYNTLATSLAIPGRVLGVRGQLESADGRPLDFSEVVAADVERLLSAVPEGPYLLAGYSFGGLVAFEVARRLTASGHAVEFVGLLDVRAPLAALSGRDRLLRRTAERVAFLVPGWSENTVRGFLRDHFRPTSSSLERRLLIRASKVYDAHEWGPYNGAVTYFRAHRGVPVITNQLYAWRRVAPDLRVVDIPGAHHSLLDSGNAPIVARRMSETLLGRSPVRATASAREAHGEDAELP